jgi:hypothetical protein
MEEVGITSACNLTAAGALLSIASGASIVLYNPRAKRNERGRTFIGCLK